MKTLVVGHITHDYYAQKVVAGGCAFYGAKVHARLAGPGDRTHLLAVVGRDFSCAEAIADLDTTLHKSGRTTVFANHYPPDQPRIQLLQALAGPVLPEMAPPEWLAADLIHLTPVLGEVDLGAWKTAARRARPDGLLAINIQGWIKHAGPKAEAAEFPHARRVVQKFWEVCARDFHGVDIACLSEEDVLDQPGLLEKLVAAVPIVAFTRGGLGSRIYVDGGIIDVGVYPTRAPDPTGAGDVFAASFTHQIARGLEPAAAAQFAAAAASIVVEATGPAALPRLHEAAERAPHIPLS